MNIRDIKYHGPKEWTASPPKPGCVDGKHRIDLDAPLHHWGQAAGVGYEWAEDLQFACTVCGQHVYISVSAAARLGKRKQVKGKSRKR